MKTIVILSLSLVLSVIANLTLRTLDVAKYSAKHVVLLEDATGSGTGFYVNFKGKTYLVSNKHVCGDKEGLYAGDRYHKVIALSTEHDLCLLEGNRSEGLELAESTPNSLDKVYVVGHPMGHALTARSGRFVEFKYDNFPFLNELPIEVMLISVAIFGGNSGSPVMNADGKVIAVAFAMNARTEEDAYSVPKEALIKFLNSHER